MLATIRRASSFVTMLSVPVLIAATFRSGRVQFSATIGTDHKRLKGFIREGRYGLGSRNFSQATEF